ncbi:MAG: YciI family protein, partial [Candidatus Limnocylindrales bacterium]
QAWRCTPSGSGTVTAAGSRDERNHRERRRMGIVKYVLFYESADDVSAKAASHFAAHRARWVEFSKAGTLLMIGTFSNPQDEGSMAIFTSREAAEEFARSDPFVLHGVVRHWYIREWNEALA